jgi:WD40 repeat protein
MRIMSGGHRDIIVDLRQSPTDQTQLFSASADGTVQVWDWRAGTLLLFSLLFYN